MQVVPEQSWQPETIEEQVSQTDPFRVDPGEQSRQTEAVQRRHEGSREVQLRQVLEGESRKEPGPQERQPVEFRQERQLFPQTTQTLPLR